MERSQLGNKFNYNAPTTLESIRRWESNAGLSLPKDYAKFLCHANGGEGFVGNAYILLWQLEDLLQLNKAYQVEQYAAGLLLFGSDGGGEAFAFDMRQNSMPIVSVPFVGMSLNELRFFADDFDSFVERLSKMND